MQQQVTYIVEGWATGPNGGYCRKEKTGATTLDGVVQCLRYLNTVQGYKYFTVSTHLVDLLEGGISEDSNQESPQDSPKEIQA